VPFPAPIVHLNAPDLWSRARRYSARVDHDVYFKLEPAARRSSAKTYSECRLEMLAQLIRFHNLTGSRPTHCGTREYPSHGFPISSSKQPWPCPRFRSQANETAASISVENRMENEFAFEQGPAALALDHDQMQRRSLRGNVNLPPA
jgi:hypothetical protein